MIINRIKDNTAAAGLLSVIRHIVFLFKVPKIDNTKETEFE